MILAAWEPATRPLRGLGIDSFIPVFPTETATSVARRDVGPETATATWDAARRANRSRWELILDGVNIGELARAAEELTLTQAPCSRAAELAQLQLGHLGSRCHLCSLSHAREGRREDRECRSVREPLPDALRTGEVNRVRGQTYAIVETLRHLADHGLAIAQASAPLQGRFTQNRPTRTFPVM